MLVSLFFGLVHTLLLLLCGGINEGIKKDWNCRGIVCLQIQEKGEEGVPVHLTKEQRPLPNMETASVFRMVIPSLSPGASITLQVEVVFYEAIKPFPEEVTQNEKQLVIYHGNSYFFSPYTCLTQSSNFKLPSSTKLESHTKVSPTNHADDTITYGPYSDLPPHSSSKISVHFENNGPFLTVVELERVIEISHWGNIAVEEHVHVVHSGGCGWLHCMVCEQLGK